MLFCNTAMHWLSYACFCSIFLGDECEDNVCSSVCPDVELKHIIAQIDLMFLHTRHVIGPTRGLDLL